MNSSMLSRRRALAQALVGALFVSTSRFSFGLSKDEESQDKAGPGKANGKPGKPDGQQKDKDAAKPSKGAVLTVVVIGNGKPIPQAEVQVKLPGAEQKRPTNQVGEASFTLPATGAADVRVLAAGWESALKGVVLEQGPQKVTIELKSLPDPR